MIWAVDHRVGEKTAKPSRGGNKKENPSKIALTAAQPLGATTGE